MTAILPQGLINATAAIEQYSFDDSDVYVTNSDVLRRLWKGLSSSCRRFLNWLTGASVYAVQSDVTLDHPSTRSRNLFWRVWSSPKLTRSITSGRLTSLWQRCSQDFELTPIGDQLTWFRGPTDQVCVHTASLNTKSANRRYQDFPAPRQVRNRSSSLSPTSGAGPNLETSPRAGQNIGPSLQDFRFPPTTGEVYGSRHHPSTEHPVEPRQQQLDDTSESASHDTSESSLRHSLTRSTNGGRARLPVLANAGKARTRPQIPRRKSSSQKSPLTPNAPKLFKGSHEASGRGSNSHESSNARIERRTTQNPPPGLVKAPCKSIQEACVSHLIVCRSYYQWINLCLAVGIFMAKCRFDR